MNLFHSSIIAMTLTTIIANDLPVTADEPQAPTANVLHRTVRIDNLDIFYREAGPKDAPTVLLLHGFPTSSHMFRNLIPALAEKYHVVAPDYPGFGNSSSPSVDEYPRRRWSGNRCTDPRFPRQATCQVVMARPLAAAPQRAVCAL